MIARLRPQLAKVAGATLYLQPVQDVRAGGRAGNAQYQYTLRAQSVADFRAWAPRVLEACASLPALLDLNSDQQDKAEQVQLVVDRDAIARLGITQRDVDETLNDLYGQRLVSTIYTPDNQYRVVLEGERAGHRQQREPRATFISSPPMAVHSAARRWREIESVPTSLNVNHQGQFAATTFTFNLVPGASLSDATRDIHQALAQLALPAGIEASFQGTAKVFQDALANQVLLIIAALASVYIVLGILYESYIHPLTILSTLPSAGVGALLALELCHMDFSLIALIGVILLIGIVKKNAIMMIDFAQGARREHAASVPSRPSARPACCATGRYS